MVDRDPGSPTWKFTQCFGDKGDVEDITEADIISTVEFDHTGNYLATGDKGGRVVLFERNETVSQNLLRLEGQRREEEKSKFTR
jgi:serine/threonine-protein phosphatase 2A regulatory subunit B